MKYIEKLDKDKERNSLKRNDSPYILFEASTYRKDTIQIAEVTVTVRRVSSPERKDNVEVWKCQFLEPVLGEEVRGRRVDHVIIEKSWPIDSNSDEAMKDFTVTAFASSQGIGNLQSTVKFKYKEMK